MSARRILAAVLIALGLAVTGAAVASSGGSAGVTADAGTYHYG